MKQIIALATGLLLTLVPGAAFAEYTCTGTFLKNAGEYEKNAQIVIYDYYYKNGTLVYGVPKIGYLDAKLIKLDKNCVLERLERRLDLEMVR